MQVKRILHNTGFVCTCVYARKRQRKAVMVFAVESINKADNPSLCPQLKEGHCAILAKVMEIHFNLNGPSEQEESWMCRPHVCTYQRMTIHMCTHTYRLCRDALLYTVCIGSILTLLESYKWYFWNSWPPFCFSTNFNII